MAKVTIYLEDTEKGLKIEPKFEPEISSMEEDADLTSAQIAAFDILQALAAAADEVILEDESFAKSDNAKKEMH